MLKKIMLLVLMVTAVFSQNSYAVNTKPTNEISRMYYNLSQHKLYKFTCEVSTDLFEQMKETIYSNLGDEDKKALETIKCSLSYEGKKFAFKVSKYPKFRNEKMNQGMTQVLNGTEKMAIAFFTTWNGIVSEPILNEGENYDFTEIENGYITHYQDKGNDVELVFDKDYVLQKMTFGTGKQGFIMIPKFTETNEGLLISEMDFNMGDGAMKEHMTISYKKIEDIYLPEIVKTNVKMYQSDLNVTLKFLNYSVE